MEPDGIGARLVIPSTGSQPSTPVGAAPGVPVPSGSPKAGSGLPRTGTELLAVLLLAVILLALGALLVHAGRARRRPRPLTP